LLVPLRKKKPRQSGITFPLSIISLFLVGPILFSACTAGGVGPQTAPTAAVKPQETAAPNAAQTKPAASETGTTRPASTAGPQPTPTQPAATTAGTPAQATATPATVAAAGPSSSNLPVPSNRVQKNEGGSVTIEVKWPAVQAADDALPFAATMDTHSVDLDKIDLSKLATLRNDKGQQVAPTSWEAPAGGHHRSGTLVFPATDSGKALVDPGTKYVELVIRDLAGVKERVLRWSLGDNV